MQRLMMNSSRKDVKPLEEDAAVAEGSEMFSEVFVFAVAVIIAVNEYQSSNKKTAAKESKLADTLSHMNDGIKGLEAQLVSMNQQQLELQRNLEVLRRENDRREEEERKRAEAEANKIHLVPAMDLGLLKGWGFSK
jgi:hypothetical protein